MLYGFSSKVVSWLCLLAVAAQTPQKPAPKGDYFPVKQGSTWTYQMIIPQIGSGDVQTRTQVVTVTKVTKDKTGTLAVLDYREDDKPAFTEKYRITANMVNRIAAGFQAGEKLVPPFPLIRFPLTVDKTWSWKGKIVQKTGAGGAEATMSVTGPEEIVVPAGKFMAYQVHCEQVLMGQLDGKPKRVSLPADYWFAPGVGLVQRKVRFPDTIVNIQLTSFKVNH